MTENKPWAERQIVGLSEIAEYMGWSKGSAYSAKYRASVAPDAPGALPQPDEVLAAGKTPVWYRATIETWARNTGRLQDDGTIVKRKSGPVPTLSPEKIEQMKAQLVAAGAL